MSVSRPDNVWLLCKMLLLQGSCGERSLGTLYYFCNFSRILNYFKIKKKKFLRTEMVGGCLALLDMSSAKVRTRWRGEWRERHWDDMFLQVIPGYDRLFLEILTRSGNIECPRKDWDLGKIFLQKHANDWETGNKMIIVPNHWRKASESKGRRISHLLVWLQQETGVWVEQKGLMDNGEDSVQRVATLSGDSQKGSRAWWEETCTL